MKKYNHNKNSFIRAFNFYAVSLNCFCYNFILIVVLSLICSINEIKIVSD